jgi:two-component system repressor protein LuxO
MELINEAIRQCDGNVSRAAALLELSPSTVYRRLREAEEKAEGGGFDAAE